MKDKDVIKILDWVVENHFYFGIKEAEGGVQLWIDKFSNPALTTAQLLKKAKKDLGLPAK